MKTLVIGGGMSGLTYGIVACKNGYDVTIAERNSRVGKKIAMTGNGKCNIGNANVSAACFNTNSIVPRVLRAVTAIDYKIFLVSCGIYTHTDSEGRMYPLSDSASNVVDCLRHQYAKFGGKLLLDTTVTSVTKAADGYDVNLDGRTEHYDKVVVCCGSHSQAESTFLQNLVPPRTLTPMVPSLVPIKVRGMVAPLNGLRVRAGVTLFADGTPLETKQGEVLFREYGLSGICIMDLSAHIARREVQRKSADYVLSLDLVPHMGEGTLRDIVQRRLDAGERDKAFYGILHNKVGEFVLRWAGEYADGAQIAHQAKNLRLRYEKLLDWSMSQATAGGVDVGYVDPDTLALDNGVVVLGEALNVDGVCGGNNLYFAAASALYTFSPKERERAYSIS